MANDYAAGVDHDGEGGSHLHHHQHAGEGVWSHLEEGEIPYMEFGVLEVVMKDSKPKPKPAGEQAPSTANAAPAAGAGAGSASPTSGGQGAAAR